MKKFIIIMLILIPLHISAAEYDIKSADLKMSFPDDWYVFTRDNIKNNENLKKLNVTEEYMNSFFVSNDAYFDALETNVELVLRISDKVDFKSLSDFPDEKVLEYASDMGAINKTENYKVYTNKYKYVILNYNSANYNVIMYATVINSKWYTYSAQKKSEFTASEASDIKKIIDSIEYNIIEEDLEKIEAEKEKIEEDSKKDRIKIILAYIMILAIGVAFGLHMFIFRKRKKQEI